MTFKPTSGSPSAALTITVIDEKTKEYYEKSLEIKERKIANYQVITPSSWNISPRDDKGQPGPLEQAITGAKIKEVIVWGSLFKGDTGTLISGVYVAFTPEEVKLYWDYIHRMMSYDKDFKLTYHDEFWGEYYHLEKWGRADKIDIDSKHLVVIAHGEPEHDYLALEKIVKRKPAYIGLLGSRTKVATLVKRLKATGISDSDLKSLHAPLGLDIGAQTPEEIGISILAEITSERRKGTKGPKSSVHRT
jgi:hypothetical protein